MRIAIVMCTWRSLIENFCDNISFVAHLMSKGGFYIKGTYGFIAIWWLGSEFM